MLLVRARRLHDVEACPGAVRGGAGAERTGDPLRRPVGDEDRAQRRPRDEQLRDRAVPRPVLGAQGGRRGPRRRPRWSSFGSRVGRAGRARTGCGTVVALDRDERHVDQHAVGDQQRRGERRVPQHEERAAAIAHQCASSARRVSRTNIRSPSASRRRQLALADATVEERARLGHRVLPPVDPEPAAVPVAPRLEAPLAQQPAVARQPPVAEPVRGVAGRAWKRPQARTSTTIVSHGGMT